MFIQVTAALALSIHRAHEHACQQTLPEIPQFRQKLFHVTNDSAFTALIEMKWFNHEDFKVPYHHSSEHIKLIHLWIVLLEHFILFYFIF